MRRCMAEGVRQQIADHLPYAHRIDLDRRQIGRRVDVERHVLRVCLTAERADDIARQLAQIDRLLLQLQGAAFRQRERPQVLDETRQDVRFLEELFQLTVIARIRSEEHTSELQSQSNLVCRLLLEKKKKKKTEQDDQMTKKPVSQPSKF